MKDMGVEGRTVSDPSLLRRISKKLYPNDFTEQREFKARYADDGGYSDRLEESKEEFNEIKHMDDLNAKYYKDVDIENTSIPSLIEERDAESESRFNALLNKVLKKDGE